MSAPVVRLDAESIEAVARRTTELLREDDPKPLGPALMTVAEVSSRLGRSADWVREHREELSVRVIGTGERPRLLFPREAVEALARTRKAAAPPTTTRAARLRARPPADLLPIRGERGA